MLAALLKPLGGTVTAFERDPERFKTLKRMLDTARAKCMCAWSQSSLIVAAVRHVLQDFMAIDPADPSYANVTHLLVDPSCCAQACITIALTVSRLWHRLAHGRAQSVGRRARSGAPQVAVRLSDRHPLARHALHISATHRLLDLQRPRAGERTGRRAGPAEARVRRVVDRAAF